MLFNWSTAHGTRQILGATVVLVGAPESIAVVRRAGSPIETLTGIRRNAQGVLEILAAARRQGRRRSKSSAMCWPSGTCRSSSSTASSAGRSAHPKRWRCSNVGPGRRSRR